MIRNYIRIAWRNLMKNRLTSFINIFGLGLSMSVGLMIMIRMQDDFSFDKFHPHPDRTYRVTSEYQKKNDVKWQMASTPLPLYNTLTRDINTIEYAVNIYPALNGKATADGKEIYLNAAFTEPSFFNVFGFSLGMGNPETALEMPNSIVLSRPTAQKLFGDQNAIGKTIKMESKTNFQVTGVLNDAPGKSHLNFDAYGSYSTIAQMEADKTLPGKSTDDYAFNAGYTYVLLKNNRSKLSVQSQLNSIAAGMNSRDENGITGFHLQPLGSITPGSAELNNNIGGGSSWTKIYIEAGMALLILLAACFNYTNLTIARSLTRAKEVGVRKIVGAKRSQVFVQYIIESVLLSLLALCFAWLVLFFVVRYAPFNDDYEFIPSSFHYNPVYIAWSLLYGLLTGVLAGASPAWILSAFKPLRILKNLSTAKIMGKIGLQKSLIVFQYSLSLVVIIFLFAFYKQFSFMASADPGFKRNNVMIIPLNGIKSDVAAHAIENISGVKSLGASSARFTKHFSGMNIPVWVSDKTDKTGLNYYYADKAFINSLQFSFVAGQGFPAQANSEEERYIILNESAAHALGFSATKNAVGKKLWINDSAQLEISGVVKDFAYESAGKTIGPLAFRNKKDAAEYLYVPMEGADRKSMEAKVASVISTLQPTTLPAISWVADDLEQTNSQVATISLLGFLGFIALAIASLGLLGLVIYAVQVKGKEISIRKIIGASEKQLLGMLSKGFVKLLLIAGCIAMPIGWFLTAFFLRNFSNRVNFGWLNVVGCFLFLLVVGLLAILPQTYRAAISNPAKSLRTE